jgi:transcriptional regulator with XRE-family HTH domain
VSDAEHDQHRPELEPVARLLRAALAAHRLTATDLAQAAGGASRSAAARWTSARATPPAAALDAAAELTGLPVVLLEQALHDPEDAYSPFDPDLVAAHLERTDTTDVRYAERADQVTVGTESATPTHGVVTADATLVLPDQDGTVRNVSVGELVGRWLSTNGAS